jgi:hypothetical protein
VGAVVLEHVGLNDWVKLVISTCCVLHDVNTGQPKQPVRSNPLAGRTASPVT